MASGERVVGWVFKKASDRDPKENKSDWKIFPRRRRREGGGRREEGGKKEKKNKSEMKEPFVFFLIFSLFFLLPSPYLLPPTHPPLPSPIHYGGFPWNRHVKILGNASTGANRPNPWRRSDKDEGVG